MTEPTIQNHPQAETVVPMGQRIFLISGLVFLFGALALFGITAYIIYIFAPPYLEVGYNVNTPEEIMNLIISVFTPLLFLGISATICVFAGLQLLAAAGAVSTQVIPPREYDLLATAIREGNEQAISQYIRTSDSAVFQE